MRKYALIVAVAMGLGGSQAWAQEGDWAVLAYFSHTLLYGDSDFDHPSKSLSPGSGITLQYGATDYLRVYGDLNFGSANGGNTVFYYENQHLQGLAGAQLDFLKAFGMDSKIGIYGDAGIGWNFGQSQSWEYATGLVRRVPANGAFTNSAVFGFGGGASYSITNQVDVYAGYRTSILLDNDWADAYSSGESNDWLGQISFGVRFALNGSSPQVRIDPTEYDELVSARRQAESERDDAVAELAAARRQYDAQIEDLYNVLSVMNNNIDSLNQKITVLRQSDRGVSTYDVQQADGTVTPGANLWRIVVGSFPTAQGAQEFASRAVIPNGEYEVVFIEDLSTYRVVYKSYNSLALARQDLEEVRATVPDAWIIRF
ncbi:MAG: outer membrane beta-barrel protein [Flavobacteriia bacterium]|nr:outer membrane beta-barrel protein [Flavobacteriia bacterium]